MQSVGQLTSFFLTFFRHEKPTDPDDPLADQNIKDRYYGVNDPVADKLMRRAASMPALMPPDDRTITTLYVGGLGDTVGEKELRDNFHQYGEIRNLNIIPRQQCAFIQFGSRQAAENAAEKTFNKLIINGRRLVIKWGRSQAGKEPAKAGEDGYQLEPVPGLPGPLPPPDDIQNNFFNLNQAVPLMPPMGLPPLAHPGMRPPPMPPGLRPPWLASMPRPPPGMIPIGPLPTGAIPPMMPVHYPSQDPQRMGSIEKPAEAQPTVPSEQPDA